MKRVDTKRLASDLCQNAFNTLLPGQQSQSRPLNGLPRDQLRGEAQDLRPFAILKMTQCDDQFFI